MIIKKRILLAVVSIVTLGLAVLVFVLMEINKSKEDLLQTLKKESITLISTLSLSIENTILTNIEIEDLIIKRLNTTAELVAHSETHSKGSEKTLQNIAEDFEISYISILNQKGKVINSTHSKNYQYSFFSQELIDELQPLFQGEYKWMDFGIVEDKNTNESYYILARRRIVGKGCILIGLNSEKLLDFRKKIGIGKKIQDIGSNPNIIYAVLQDYDGIISASKNVRYMPSIESDSFLIKAWNTNKIMSREYDFDGVNKGFDIIFEVVKTISVNNEEKKLVRIGLSMESIRVIQGMAVRRAFFLGLGIFLTGVFLIGFIISRQKFEILRQEHSIIQQYTSHILNNIADAVIAVNHDVKIIVFNQAAEKIFSFSSNDVINNYYSDIFQQDQLKIRECLNEKKSILFDEINYVSSQKGKATKRKILGLSVSLIKADNNETEMLVAIIRDLTEQKRVNELLQRKDKLLAMGELAAGVAHEIRNPLNAINIISQRFQYEFEPIDDKEEYNKLIGIVRSEVSRVNGIIKQFLEFAKPSKLELKPVSITTLINESVQLLESQAKMGNIDFVVEIEEEIISLIDNDKMKQVLINLFLNSIESMKNGGLLTINLSSNIDRYIIRISDTGAGIPDEIKSKIFNLYFTSKSTGTGLGLSIVHQIVTEHNGDISFESQVGSGTVFTLTFQKME